MTRADRFAALNFGSPVPLALPNPDSSVEEVDRAALTTAYSIAAFAPAEATALGVYRTSMHRRRPYRF